MLTPEYLEDLPEEILKLFYDAEQEILADMARRVSTYDYWIPAAEYQRQKLREAGVLQEDILKSLSGITGRSEAELKRLMQEAGTEALRSDAAVYEAAGMTVPKVAESEPLRAILNAGYKATAQTMRNICKTTAQTATMQFENALDLAWLKVQSGAFDTDSAVRAAIKEISERGIQSIRYPSGRTDSIEVAVRRAVVTGVNQTAGQLQEELADELGCDLVEVSAHAGARPEHAEWQGKIFSRSGNDPKYPDFKKSTGYGTGAGLCGWNCRHTFGPYIEGSPPVWSEEQLAELNAPKYEYNGKMLTEYEASQQQRYNERQIRRWKREEAAMKAAGLDSSEAAAKVTEWQGRQQEFLSQTGFKRQYAREITVGASVSATQEKKIDQAIRYARASDIFCVIPPFKGDAIKAQSIYKELRKSEVGKKALEYIIEHNTPVEVNYTDEVRPDVRGATRGGSIFIYARNTKTIRLTTQTIIHEVTHLMLDTPYPSQHEEAVCFSQEKKHLKSELTYSDLRDIIKEVKKSYSDLPWR